MNAHDLAQRMAGEVATIAQFLLPGGKRQSGEWKCGSLSGEAGQSLSVRLSGAKAGVWADFSTGEKGDILDLWVKVRGCTVPVAMTEAMQYLGIREAMPQQQQPDYKRPSKPMCQTPKAGALEWLKNRGLTEKTLADFKIAEQVRDGKTYAIFPYIREGEYINAKYRNVAEKKDMRQEGGAEPCLFGWHLIDPNCRTVAICEGELDAMTLHQVGIPALSVNAGAGNHQWIASDWQRLERFSEILVCFDADEAGQKGAQEVMHRLGNERCKLVQFGSAKDANEYLLAKAEAIDFEEAIKAARPQDPLELKQANEFMARVKHLFYPAHSDERDPVLWLDRAIDWFEFRAGELTVWTGINGHGKSLMLSQVLLGLMQQGERACVFSGEMTPERQLKRMVKQAAGLDRPSLPYLDEIGRWLQDRLWLFNVVGSAGIDRLLTVFAYANKRYGIRHFVIDSLMMTDVPEDGAGAMTAQKEAMRKLCDFAKRNACHLHLVAHPRKGKDEANAPGKLDVAGSSKITDAADNVFTVWSARKDEAAITDPDKPDASLELQKQRNGDVQHYRLSLWFNREAQQFTTTSRRAPVRFVEYSNQTKVTA